MAPEIKLPPVTIVIEWENAIDVEDDWTEKAMAGLQRELESVVGRVAAKPRVTYLFDENAVDPEVIRNVMARAAPRLPEVADLEILATPGLTYYQLKNFGVARATTEISIMLDSDASPQPGWLEGILQPFEDPAIMAVGGFTVLGYDDLLSKTMALSWIFDLADEADKTVRRHKIHANNCAVRTEFFRANPFPDLQAFKKQCGFWLRDLAARGHRYLRTAEARTVHAPHPGYRFLVWRAWTSGMDRDFQGYHTVSRRRVGRLAYAVKFFAKKVRRSWSNILIKGARVELPVWQRPIAMTISLAFFLIAFVGQVLSAFTRSFSPLERPIPQTA